MHELPIDDIQEQFLKALDSGPVVVEAPAGSGKSTRLPLWCAGRDRVLVIEPRRLACRSLAGYLATQKNEPAGRSIGYAVRYDSRFERETGVVFATPGVALRWLAADGLSGFGCLILDEFHERRWDTDLLAALTRGRFARLVATSATLEGAKLAEYFQASRIQAQGRSYPVQVEYYEKTSLPSTHTLEQRVLQAVQTVLQQGCAGDILVFLPGRREISQCKGLLEQSGLDLEVLPLHASVEQSLQDRAFQSAAQPRIILATNVAETSLTLPGVRAVIDSGLERRTHHRNDRTVLGLHAVSQAAAEQRRGRAGRLKPGVCHRLWGASAKLEPYTPPEILREELTDLFLAAAVCGLQAETLTFADPLPGPAQTRARDRLQRMQAIDDRGRITRHGRSFFQLPLDPLFAHLIMSMPDGPTREMMVDLAGALSVQGRVLPTPKTVQEQAQLKQWAPEPCDALTLIRLLRLRRVQAPSVQEARRIAEQTRALLDLPGLAEASGVDRDRFLESVIRAAPELVYVRRKKRRRALGNGSSEVEIGSDSRMPDRSEAALIFDEHSVPGKGTSKTVTFATCLAPVKLTMLERLNLGRLVYSHPRIVQGRVVVQCARLYADREIASEEAYPVGSELCRALAELILENRFWKGVGEQLKTDCAAWNLYCCLGKAEGAPVEPFQWLSSRLEALGVEVQDDLDLLDPGDVHFEGVPDWERERFDLDWPRFIDLHDLKLRVDYDPAVKRIEMTKVGGSRNTVPKRLELPSWPRNWRLRYREGQRIVEIP